MEFELEYNSQMENLVIPEYGRNVQKLIRHVKTITDLKERQVFAEQVVNLMSIMNPQNKNVPEYKKRLWKHFFVIGGFDMNVTPPVGLDLEAVKVPTLPDKVPYPDKVRRFRHYGRNVKTLINKAIEMEEGPVKDGFVETIASFMKLAYKNWNREHYVSDEIILADLETMSEGKLKLSENSSLDTLTRAIKTKKRFNNQSSGRSGRNNKSNNRHRNNRRKGRR